MHEKTSRRVVNETFFFFVCPRLERSKSFASANFGRVQRTAKEREKKESARGASGDRPEIRGEHGPRPVRVLRHARPVHPLPALQVTKCRWPLLSTQRVVLKSVVRICLSRRSLHCKLATVSDDVTHVSICP